jgi:hypothetical protein
MTIGSTAITMATNVIQDKQQVHELLERLAPSQLHAVRGLLEAMLDPVARSIAHAPLEDEEITPEMAAELDRARASIERGEGIPHDEILREFGLTPRS